MKKTKPLSVMKSNLVYFDSFMIDRRPGSSLKEYNSHIGFSGKISFFRDYSRNELLSNAMGSCALPGCFASKISQVRLHAAFSDPALAQEFFRSSVLELFVDSKNAFTTPVFVFASYAKTKADDDEDDDEGDDEGDDEVDDEVDDRSGTLIEQYPGGYHGMLRLPLALIIKRNQALVATIAVPNALVQVLGNLKPPEGYALISVGLEGISMREIL